ncbi:MAG: glycosyltransferase [Niabella sp.]|nr:MAG: glycosyltransferase [Niabella sp.]
MSNHKLTLTIGMPAHNEEQNIKQLINALLNQTDNFYKLEKIIVNCDNCSDKTAEFALSVNPNLVHVIDNKDQKGPAFRQNQIMNITDSEVLVILNADILPANQHFLDELIKPVAEGNADLTASRIIFTKPQLFFEKIIAASVDIKNRVFNTYKDGNNVYTCHGTARAFSKKLYKQLDFNKTIAEDAYSYLFCVQQGMNYAFAEKSVAIYKLPDNFKDHNRQSTRFINGINELKIHFSQEFLDAQYRYPKILMLKSFVAEFFHNPIFVAAYVGLIAYIRFSGYFKRSKNFSGAWETAKSTKSISAISS